MSDIVKPTKQVVTFRAPYREPKFVALKKDVRLVVEFSRFHGQDPEVEVRLEEWDNTKKTNNVMGVLNDEEAGQALLNFFLQTAARTPSLTQPPKRKRPKNPKGAGLI